MDVFSCFEDDKKGVIQNFTQAFKELIENMSAPDFLNLEKRIGWPKGNLQKVIYNPETYLNYQSIQALAGPCKKKLNDFFKIKENIPSSNEQLWLEEAKRDKFIFADSCNEITPDIKSRLRLYIIFKAIDQLNPELDLEEQIQ